MPGLFQPIEFSFSKFDRLDPSYQTSKKREFDRLEKIWQFYQPSSCLSKKKRLFYLILRGKTHFLFFFKKKMLKISAPNSFFQKSPNSSGLRHNRNPLPLTPGRRSLSLHAEKVSYMYQSENKHENYENHLIHGFVNLSIGKQNMKNLKNIIFWHKKLKDYGLNLFLGKTWSFRFASFFLKNLSRGMRHTKKGKIQGKTKNWKNHEGSCNLGKTFWNPKKLIISSIEKKYQLCALLESGIGGLITTTRTEMYFHP